MMMIMMMIMMMMRTASVEDKTSALMPANGHLISQICKPPRIRWSSNNISKHRIYQFNARMVSCAAEQEQPS